MIVAKAIKPKRLKDDAMRLTLLNRMRRVGTAIRKDFAETTKTWDHEVVFEQLISLTGPGPVVIVDTDDQIYHWVNDGTGEHGPHHQSYEIWAGAYTGKSDKKSLAFPSMSVPKTTPNVIGSGPGSSGGDTVFRPFVVHPGIEPRNFDKIIQKKWEPKFKSEMEDAMRQAVKASGHGA
jgi:hypothetical protein